MQVCFKAGKVKSKRGRVLRLRSECPSTGRLRRAAQDASEGGRSVDGCDGFPRIILFDEVWASPHLGRRERGLKADKIPLFLARSPR